MRKSNWIMSSRIEGENKKTRVTFNHTACLIGILIMAYYYYMFSVKLGSFSCLFWTQPGCWFGYSKGWILKCHELSIINPKPTQCMRKTPPKFNIPSGQLTWHLKIGLPKMKLVSQPSIFRCHVSFREGSPWKLMKSDDWKTHVSFWDCLLLGTMFNLPGCFFNGKIPQELPVTPF